MPLSFLFFPQLTSNRLPSPLPTISAPISNFESVYALRADRSKVHGARGFWGGKPPAGYLMYCSCMAHRHFATHLGTTSHTACRRQRRPQQKDFPKAPQSYKPEATELRLTLLHKSPGTTPHQETSLQSLHS